MQSTAGRDRLVRIITTLQLAVYTELFKARAANTPGISDAESRSKLTRGVQYQENVPLFEMLRYMSIKVRGKSTSVLLGPVQHI